MPMRSAAINETVSKLIRKYETRNPLAIAREMGIQVCYEELGEIRGFYSSIGRIKFIHINKRCKNQKFVCAHELGHAVLHPDSSTHFLRSRTVYSIGRFEKEATYFAACLIISDDELNEYNYYTHEQLSKLFGVDEDVVRLRVNGV